METEPNSISSSPPKMIASFATGFNAVANHIQIILIPIIFDLFLWFGPHLRIKELLSPSITAMFNNLTSLGSPEMIDMAKSAREMWQILIDHFNLFSLFRTFLVGVPSLMVSESPLTNPIGGSRIFELSSLFTIAGLWLGLSLVGLVFGCLYFDMVARSSSDQKSKFSLASFGFETSQILLFTIILIIAIVFLALPVTLVVSLITLISPFLAQVFLLFLSLFLLWLILPFVFTPHGIFAGRQNILAAILTSVRMVRFFLPGTGLFLILVVLISQGLDLLWRVPPENSWMTLVGIAGHAFISTGLLASSFVYFQGGMRRMQATIKETELAGSKV
ncbi:MAG: hypothetical protein IMZ61_13085 [Planctomycetes bacterium]|nr:hypothetical protein [Planctomycetota bacterium]